MRRETNILHYIDELKKVISEVEQNVKGKRKQNSFLESFNFLLKRSRADSSLDSPHNFSESNSDEEQSVGSEETTSSSPRSPVTTVMTKKSSRKVSAHTQWNKMFKALLNYGNENEGFCNVPKNYAQILSDGSEIRLGQWMNAQKKFYLLNRLQSDRREKLQELVDQGKLAWFIGPYDDQWERMFDAVVSYGEEHSGNCNVPTNYSQTLPDGSEVRLGLWLYAQRQHRRLNKLRDDHLVKLQDLVDQGKLAWSMPSDLNIDPSILPDTFMHQAKMSVTVSAAVRPRTVTDKRDAILQAVLNYSQSHPQSRLKSLVVPNLMKKEVGGTV